MTSNDNHGFIDAAVGPAHEAKGVSGEGRTDNSSEALSRDANSAKSYVPLDFSLEDFGLETEDDMPTSACHVSAACDIYEVSDIPPWNPKEECSVKHSSPRQYQEPDDYGIDYDFLQDDDMEEMARYGDWEARWYGERYRGMDFQW